MRRKTLITVLILITGITLLNGQENNEPINLASEILSNKEEKLIFGGYGQLDFSQQFSQNRKINSNLDVSRLILSMGYNFSPKTSFFSEIEFEHVKELYVEQAFINHSFSDYMSLRAGLMLVPMGIINEYHEPTTFNGVNRPSVDNIIVPTTWRELGFGFTGRFQQQGIKYQIYLMNGFLGYNGTTGLISGEKFLREARQKGAKAIMSSPDLSARIDYFGIMGLKIGLSGYFGKSETALSKDLDVLDTENSIRSDSSVVGLVMAGLDARYNKGGLALRGEYIVSELSNTVQYNSFTGNNAGKSVRGMYIEGAYNVLHKTRSEYGLSPFFRYENYNTHFKVAPGVAKVDKYNVNEYVFGLGWKLAEGAIIKADMQLKKSAADETAKKTFNAGIGVWF